MDTSTIVILDFGSQYTQLIARRIRELNVFSIVLPCTAPLDQIQALTPLGIILSGGPCSVYDADAPAADPALLALGVPVLGICYGLQFIVHHLGGTVKSAPAREYGHAEVRSSTQTPLFRGLPAHLQRLDVSRRRSEELPPGFHLTAKTSNALAGIADEDRRIWAVQFHPEVAPHPPGNGNCSAISSSISAAQRPTGRRSTSSRPPSPRIRAQVGDGHAICGLSGGVDSSVAAVLVAQRHRRPAHLHLRQQRRPAQERVPQGAGKLSASKLGLNLVAVDASARFLSKTRRRHRPRDEAQDYRQRIHRRLRRRSHTASTARRRAQNRTGLSRARSTPTSSSRSSVKGPSQTIKSHHNVGGLPRT